MEKAAHKVVRVGRIHRQCREVLLIGGFVCLSIMITIGAVVLARYLVTRKNRLEIPVSDTFETQTTTQTTVTWNATMSSSRPTRTTRTTTTTTTATTTPRSTKEPTTIIWNGPVIG